MTTEAITVGQAAKQAGVAADVLRELCEARAVKAVKRGGGHWYLSPDDVPTRQQVGELLPAGAEGSPASSSATDGSRTSTSHPVCPTAGDRRSGPSSERSGTAPDPFLGVV